MRALDPEVLDAVRAAIEPLIPLVVDEHPLGCHRRRSPDRDCFDVILVRLATGCSWEDAERLCGTKVSDTTVRLRRDEWLAAGVFDTIAAEATSACDRIIGLDLTDVALDGSLHKSPCGGEGTGKNPTDRGKLGWKWSVLTDRHGIPIGWAIDGANRNDSVMLAPTLDAAAACGLLADVETIWLDRGYDSDATRERLAAHDLDDAVIARKRRRGSGEQKKPTDGAALAGGAHETRGCRTSASCAATPIAGVSTGSPSSLFGRHPQHRAVGFKVIVDDREATNRFQFQRFNGEAYTLSGPCSLSGRVPARMSRAR